MARVRPSGTTVSCERLSVGSRTQALYEDLHGVLCGRRHCWIRPACTWLSSATNHHEQLIRTADDRERIFSDLYATTLPLYRKLDFRSPRKVELAHGESLGSRLSARTLDETRSTFVGDHDVIIFAVHSEFDGNGGESWDQLDDVAVEGQGEHAFGAGDHVSSSSLHSRVVSSCFSLVYHQYPRTRCL
jgi:hypothetical protein